ncbi:MAG: hypothetical protein ABII64_00945 [Elusimicrobiota bacterium]
MTAINVEKDICDIMNRYGINANTKYYELIDKLRVEYTIIEYNGCELMGFSLKTDKAVFVHSKLDNDDKKIILFHELYHCYRTSANDLLCNEFAAGILKMQYSALANKFELMCRKYGLEIMKCSDNAENMNKNMRWNNYFQELFSNKVAND